MTIVANPAFIASHGGVSELMVIITEPAGTDVPDGTVVLWTTNLGHVDRETRTVRGIARNRLIADSRSGEARVTAQSGADALPPTTTPSPTPSSTPGPTTPGTTTPPTTNPGNSGVLGARAAVQFAGLQNIVSADVTIGNANVATVRLRAVPSRITVSNSTHVIATVLDRFGNPVANVPVFFEVLDNRDFEFFDSAGAPIHTDNNGEAGDVLRTRRSTSGPVTVRARVPGPRGLIPSQELTIEVVR
jgi:hypothetical protein